MGRVRHIGADGTEYYVGSDGKKYRKNDNGEWVEYKEPSTLDLTDEEQTINQRIAHLRKVKRLTQKEFAEKLTVSDKLVSKWEQEGNVPSLEDVMNICKVFNLTYDYLLNGKKSRSDVDALYPVPYVPPFVDPIQTLIKKIDELIVKNKLQKYREQLFPSSSEDTLYKFVERLRKSALDEWNNIEEHRGRNSYEDYWGYIFRQEYHEDRRSKQNPIDERYWASVETSNAYNSHRHLTKRDENMLANDFGVFMLSGFGSSVKRITNDVNRLVDYDINFEINYHALLVLDNFEIYSKLTSCGVPVHRDFSKMPKATASTNYFDGLDFNKDYYARIPKRSKYDSRLGKNVDYRDYEKYPFAYEDLVGLTDLRFLSLLPKAELDFLLKKVNLKHKRVWEVIVALIDNGATKKQLARSYNSNYYDEQDDPLATLMLYEFAKMKLAQ